MNNLFFTMSCLILATELVLTSHIAAQDNRPNNSPPGLSERYVLKDGDTMNGPLVTPNLQTDLVNTSEIINPSGIFQIETGSDVEILLDRQGNATSFFEIFNGSDTHAFYVREDGNARIFGDLRLDGNLATDEIINPSGIFQIETGSDVEILLDRQGNATSFFEIFNGSDTHAFYVREDGNARIFGDLRLDGNLATPAVSIDADSGSVGIGAAVPAASYELSVDGEVICEELTILDSGSWPDFVFEDNYELQPLHQVELHIKEHRHLPGVASAAEVEQKGIRMAETQKQMMTKIEELTLYIIEQNKRLADQDRRIRDLELRLENE